MISFSPPGSPEKEKTSGVSPLITLSAPKNPFDVVTKLAASAPTSVSPYSFTPAPIKAPTPQPITFAPPAPIKAPVAAPIKAPTPAPISFNPPAQPESKVRNQDWKDVANLLPQALGMVAQPLGDIAATVVQKATGKAPSLSIPNIYQDATHGGENAYESESWQQHYEKAITSGLSPKAAVLSTALKGGFDLLAVLPVFQAVSKVGVKTFAPERLIDPSLVNREAVNVSKENVLEYLRGRKTGEEAGIPVEYREAISETFSKGTRAEKDKILQGVIGRETLDVKPSRLGEFLGVSQDDAEKILQETYGGRSREASQGQLPGYRRVPGQAPAFGLSTEAVEPVGFGESKPVFRGGGEGSMPKGKTALDIVNYEQKELGNTLKIRPDIDLATVPSERLKWVTTSEAAAKGYGAPEKQDVDNHRVIAEDGEGGQLIEVPERTQISPELEPLAVEAKKYKSAEEFADKAITADGVPIKTFPVENIERSEYFNSELAKAKSEIESGSYTRSSNEPVRLFFDADTGKYSMVDGYHRVAKAMAEGKTEINATAEFSGSKKSLTDFYNKAVGKTIASKGSATPNISKEKAEELLYGMFNKDEIRLIFDPSLLQTEGAYGIFRAGRELYGVPIKAAISLLEEGGKVSDMTLWHEAFHAYFNTFLTAEERAAMLKKVQDNKLTIARELDKKNYPSAEERAEEWLAEDFADYAKSKLGDGPEYKGFFADIWEKLLQKLRTLIRQKEKFDKLYEDIMSGKRKAGEVTAVERKSAAPEDMQNARKLNQLYKQRDRLKQSLSSYEYNPEAHVKAYGEDRKLFYETSIKKLDEKINALEPKELRSDYREKEKANQEVDRELVKESKKNLADLAQGKQDEKISQLTQVRDDLRTVLAEHPAKPLLKYVSQTTGRLPEMTGKDTMKSLTGSGETVVNSEFGRRGDQIVPELGFKDLDEAQGAVDDYLSSRKDLKQANIKLIEARKEIAQARAADADTRSANVLLNKTAHETDKLIAKEERLTRIKKAEEEAVKKISDELAKKQNLQEKINKNFLPGEKLPFLKRLALKYNRTFNPVRALDEKTKIVTEDWLRSRAVARENAQTLYKEVRTKGPQTRQEIDAYEAGKPTRYIREALDTLGTEARRAELDFSFRENYLPHAYAEDRKQVVEAIAKKLQEGGMSRDEVVAYLNGQELPKEKALRLKLNPNFVKERVFPTYSVAAKYGLSPKFQTPAELIAYYKESLDLALANRKFLDTLKADAKLLPAEDAPDTWKPVVMRFTKEGLQAPPALADLINGKFRDDNELTLRQTAFKYGSRIAKFMFDARTMAGVPGTTINSFAIGQANKMLTAAVGDLAHLDFSTALSDLKASFAFIRANSNAASQRFFEDRMFYLAKGAEQGISFAGRPGDYTKVSQNILGLFPEKGARTLPKVAKALSEMTGLTFHKLFTAKTTNSMLAQMNLQIFKDNYDMALKKGLDDESAAQFAAKTTRTMGGVLEDLGRSPDVQETMASLLTAPVFRESVMGVLADGARSYSNEFKNPLFYKSRRFIAGMAIMYAMYNLLNKKLSGHYMWSNESGHEFDLRIAFPNGDIVYIPFMPSFLAFARNMGSGVINFAEGNFKVAGQKFGSVLSTPVQLLTELWSNRDYFGRAIYKETDSAKEKIVALATYTGLSVTHPFIQESYKYISGKEPMYQALSIASELPFKFGSISKEQTNQYYEMLDAQTKKRADAKKKLQPIYDANQKLKAEGKIDQADAAYWALSDDERNLYKQLKTDAKTKATNARKPAIKAIYDRNQQMKENGQVNEANDIYWGLSDTDRKIYDSLRKSAQSVDGL